MFKQISITLLALSLALPALANSKWDSEKKQLMSRKSKLISPVIHKKLSRAQTLMGSKDYKSAFSILNKLAERKSGRKFEQAQVQQTLGFAYAQTDKLNQSIKAFEKALSLNALPAGPTLNSMYTLAQLYLAQENNKKAIETMKKWMYFAKKPSAASYILLATAYAENKQYKKALPYVNKALKSGEKLQESWLQFALAIHYELKNYKSALGALKQLTTQWPSKGKYWKQLSSIYLNLDDNKNALVAMEMAHKMGFLDKESDMLNLISLYMDQDVPLKAAVLLEDAIANEKLDPNAKHFEILSGAWLQARETSEATKALNQAAPLADHGNIFAQLGSLQLEAENWGQAIATFEKALAKGKLRQPHQVRLGLGIAKFQMQQFEAATKEFHLAAKGKRTQKAASQWLAHVNTEQARIQSMTKN